MKKIRQEFADTMLEVGKEDRRLVVLLGDISHFIMQPFAEACPGQFYNVGICEPTIVSMAAGLSRIGMIPVVHTIAPFIVERSFEQLKIDFCYHQMPGNLISVGSAFDYSNLGCTHHCYDDFALLKSLPNTQIVYPSTCSEFNLLFKQTYDNEYLTLFRIPERKHGIDIDPAKIQVGKPLKILEGRDLTIVATGPQLKNAIESREELLKNGMEAEVIYVHTIHPLDIELIEESAKKTRRLLVIEEHNRVGGLGNELISRLYSIQDLEFSSISIENFIHQYGSYDEICLDLGFSVEGILKAVDRDFKK